MAVIEKTGVHCVEQGQTAKEDHANHNKVWYASLMDDHSVFVEWGRVGKKLQSQTKNFGSESQARTFIEKKYREKIKKGYEDLDIVDTDMPVTQNTGSTKSVSGSQLKQIAKSQIKHSNPLVAKLIDYFTQTNAHQIMKATHGAITFNDTTGLFSTPLGIVGQNSIDEANDILVSVGDIVAANDHDNPDLMALSQRYLRYVPTDIGMKRFDPHMFWRSLAEVQAQKAILDSLQASLVSATSNPKTTKTKTPKKKDEQVFDVQLGLVEDPKVVAKITKFYQTSKGSHYDVRSYKVKTVYTVNIASEREAFKKVGAKMDNIWTLFHGTAASNCLSILKQGLIIPPSSSGHCTGRLYGDGVYGSDMSTKALRYATGGWGGRTANRTFMFIMDMAMGSYYEPTNSNYMSVRYPVKNYNSTFAKAGRGGIANNEMIAYSTNQVQLKYLVEFSNR